MRFSRPTLTVIMLSSMLLIVIINLRHQHQQDMPLEPMSLAPLAQQVWDTWRTQEGVQIWHAMQAGQTGQLTLLFDDGSTGQQPLSSDDWAQQLRALPPASQARSATMLLHGPWTQQEAQAMAAYIVQHQRLTALTHRSSELLICIAEQLPGALWIAEQQGRDWHQLAELQPLTEPSWPDRNQWQSWRQQQAQRLRQAWLSTAGQIDIRRHLAYHRWSEDVYRQLYQSLADSQRTAPQQAQQCLLSTLSNTRE
ncbi:hypothetical protein CHH28_05215 [Bacterioplanes sanyensis]|uniref:Uncharacterized protein n=1 Tax=Bacterioplanes sanyensis TaxID=1249553 RepID=A0A222FH79_9GAMM|nr:hypothetical protein [Bacterioplanes sanyensis]ASP38119.1 hypothetical protein CHH28_05215 [Bacterioplanes sanyensis]